MAGSVNKVTLIGNLGADPDVRSLSNGGKIVTLRLATSETWKDKSTGERREKTEWHRVVIFNEFIAGIAERYLKKGSKVYLEGSLQTRKWTDQQGVEKYSTEVVLGNYKGELQMLSGRGDEERAGPGPGDENTAGGGGSGGGYAPKTGGQGDLDDDIPF